MNNVSEPDVPAIARLTRRLERERKARLAAEAIAEAGLRDLYEKQREVLLLQMIAAAANEASAVEAAIQVALDEVCAHAGWPVGHAYLTSEERPDLLVSTSLWHLDDAGRFADFRRITEATPMPLGIGLPGRILATGKPAWIIDVTKDDNFPRARHAVDIGVRAAFGFPVLVGTQVGGVLEFFMATPSEPNTRLLELMGHIGAQLGRVVERQRANEALLASNRRLEETLAQLKEKEQQQEEANRDLERRIAERTARLAEANENLRREMEDRARIELQRRQSQKLEAIGQLAAGVAHEINTPIQFVGDNTKFLQGCFEDLGRLLEAYQQLGAGVAADAVTPEILEAVREAETAADVAYLMKEVPPAITQTLDGVARVTTIVRALKDLAHPDQPDKAPADLNQALSNTLTVARNEIKYVADVETDLGEIPEVWCHAGELNQVFLNLVVNAAHAIGDAVRGTDRRGVIRVRTAREGDMVVVVISDTGSGIPESVREKIFDPFFTTKDVGRGTGQGLAIVHNVVVGKHGGTVTFETDVGRGTTFYVRLPLDGRLATP